MTETPVRFAVPDLLTPAFLKAHARTIEGMVVKFWRSLPDRLVCPRCQQAMSPLKFGVRVFKRDNRGFPKRQARQSWCQKCRGKGKKGLDS
jgi:hypothetical protein